MSGPSTSTGQTTSLDPQIKGLILNNANRAQGIADQPFQQYNGVLGAPMSGNQNLAQGAASTLNQAGAPALNLAQNGAGGLLDFHAQNVNPATASTTNANYNNATSQGDISGMIGKYQNPYTDQVVNSTMNDLDQMRQREVMGNGQNATLNHSFGGNRTGVADALTNDQFNRTAASTIGNLRNQGFNTAAGLAGNEAGMNQQTALANAQGQYGASQYNAGAANANSQFNASNAQQAGLANQAAGISSAGINQNAANSLNNIGNSQQAGANNYLSGLLASGGVDQATANNQGQQSYQEFLRSVQHPYQGQTLLNQSLGLLPNSGTTTGTSSTNPGATGILGGFASLGNTAANLGWNPFG